VTGDFVTRDIKRIAIAALSVIVVAVVIYVSYPRSVHAKGVELRVETTQKYGAVLVVDGGELGGFPLYEFSGDGPGHIGCTTVKAEGYDLDPDARVQLTCTGPEKDLINAVTSDDWPALTTSGNPVAGPGVSQRLLGTIERKGIGDQVTYAGHPLYLFDPSSAPFRPLGVDYVETVAPLAPWHGYWFLVGATNGDPVSGVVSLTRATLPNGSTVLAVTGDPNIDPFAVVVYTDSRDRRNLSTCTGACALTWVPVVTTATPHATSGVPSSAIGTIHRANGTLQVTYDGKPLYLYARERVSLKSHGGIERQGTAGNGAGLSWPSGGSFSAVPLSSP
jgi:predicted lipoprotein with Yx(FWY)xxD motif